MYDLKKWFLMPSVSAGLKLPNGTIYGRETHHLEGMNLTNNTKVYAYHHDTGKSMWFTKTPQKFPWDVKEYDQNFIYDTATELNWTSDRDFKKMNPRLPMCPRFWNGNPTLYQFNPATPYDTYQNCVVTGHGDVKESYFTLQGPFGMDYKGDVGIRSTILLTYYWHDMQDREQIFLTDPQNGFGWVDWSHATLQQLSPNLSQYKVDSYVTHNLVRPGSLVPQFPCLVIP